MAKIRNHTREKFTVVDNSAIRDENLSLKALGLLVKLLSLPDNWEFSENGLDAIFKKDGKTSIKTAIKELETNGYLKRKQCRDDKGRLSHSEWIISEVPQTPSSDFQLSDNVPNINTNILNTKKTNKEYIDYIGHLDKPNSPLSFSVDIFCKQIDKVYNKNSFCYDKEDVVNVVDYFFNSYDYNFGLENHSKVSQYNVKKIVENFGTANVGYEQQSEVDLSVEDYISMIDIYMQRDFGVNVDNSIVHFFQPKMIDLLASEIYC